VSERPVPRERFCGAVERCVAALRRRLEREEHELFPLARSVVGGDAWFAIANQMLAHDAYARERREAPGYGIRRIDAGPPELGGRDTLGHDFGRRHVTLSIAH
jgi:hypothetical protein